MKVERLISKAGRALIGATLLTAVCVEARAVPLAGTWILEVEEVVMEGAFPDELVPDVGTRILIEYVVDPQGDADPSPDTGVYDPVPAFVLRFPAGEIELDLRLRIDNDLGFLGYEILLGGFERVPLDRFISNPAYPIASFSLLGELIDTDEVASQGDDIPLGELDLSRFDSQDAAIGIALGTEMGLEEGEPDSLLSFRGRPVLVEHTPEPGVRVLLTAAALLGLRRHWLHSRLR